MIKLTISQIVSALIVYTYFEKKPSLNLHELPEVKDALITHNL